MISHGQTIYSLFKNESESEALPFIIKPVTITTTNNVDKQQRRPKVLDSLERKWQNNGWGNF